MWVKDTLANFKPGFVLTVENVLVGWERYQLDNIVRYEVTFLSLRKTECIEWKVVYNICFNLLPTIFHLYSIESLPLRKDICLILMLV